MSIKSVPNLIQGCSQQGDQQRRDSQCESQFDCLNSPLEGAIARPGSVLVKMFPGLALGGAAFQEIERDTENYLAWWIAAPAVMDLADGTLCTLNYVAPLVAANTDGYLNTSGSAPRTIFRTQVVEDTTFFINRLITPAMAATLSAARNPEAIVFVRSGSYSTTYSVGLNGPASLTANYTTPASNDPPNEAKATTSYIAEQLRLAINGVSGYTCVRSGSSLKITRGDNVDFSVITVDGNGDDFMYAFKDKVGGFGRLPRRGFTGSTLEVVGDTRAATDSYWVQFVGAEATGSWSEVVKPSLQTTLNAATMPHLLVNTGYRTFDWKQAPWSTRICGDDNSAPVPSLVGRKLRDVFYHSGRLGLLHAAGVVLSKSAYPYTLFPDTVQTVLDTAPIDARLTASGSSKSASQMDFAVQIDEGLFLWAQKYQARIASGDQTLKQDTIDPLPSSAFEYATTCDPLALGTLLYFTNDSGEFSSVRSLQFLNGRPVGETDVTAHVKKYIEAGIRGMTPSDTNKVIFLWGTSGSVFYVYNYLLNGNEYVQSAWNQWRIPGGGILWAGVKSNILRVLQQRAEGVAFLRFDLTPGKVDADAGATYATRLDLRVSEGEVSGLAYNAVNDYSTFTLPYTPTGDIGDFVVVTREDKVGGHKRGRVFETLGVVGPLITVRGDLTGYKFYAGQRITAERTESRFYVRSEEGAKYFNRLTITAYDLQMSKTGYTRIEVSTPNKEAKTYSYEGRNLVPPTAIVGGPQIGTDTLRAPVGELAENATIRLVNDSFLPSAWQKADWDYEGV